MRQRFEKDIRVFNELAKDEVKKSSTEDLGQFDDLAGALSWHLKAAAERQGTGVEVQQEIYNLQKEKQKIMSCLKDQLVCLDNPQGHLEQQEGERLARFDEARNGFIYRDDMGREQVASFGEIVTDLAWGLTYYLDPSTTPRLMLKKYFIEKAKQKIQELLDLQIIKSEVGGNVASPFLKRAYQAVEQERRDGRVYEHGGFVAETMVKNFLRKIIFAKGLPFEVLSGDIFQDVEQKIDFIIHRKERQRGVNVEANSEAQDIGVQFSINPFATRHKMRQVAQSKIKLQEANDSIQDIALVVFPIKMIYRLRDEWQSGGRVAGGPDKLLNRNSAVILFKELLKDIFSADEIEQYWNTVQDVFPEKAI